MYSPRALSGIASTAEFGRSGTDRFALARSARAGRTHRVGYGLYSATPAFDPLVLASRYGVVSHASAAALHGLDLLDETALHITSTHRRRSPPADVQVHRGHLAQHEVVGIGDIRVTTPLRTLLDCARYLEEPAAVVLADSALRKHQVSLPELWAEARRCAGPGSARVRRVVCLANVASESALETLARLLFAAHGLHPKLQVVITDAHGFVARVDFLFEAERLVVEADGHAHHSDRASFQRDRQRCNALVAAGYRVLRFSWADVVGRPDHVVSLVRSLLAPA